MGLRFVMGCDLEEFKRYYGELATDKEWRRTFEFTEELGEEWERLF